MCWEELIEIMWIGGVSDNCGDVGLVWDGLRSIGEWRWVEMR